MPFQPYHCKIKETKKKRHSCNQTSLNLFKPEFHLDLQCTQYIKTAGPAF